MNLKNLNFINQLIYLKKDPTSMFKTQLTNQMADSYIKFKFAKIFLLKIAVF